MSLGTPVVVHSGATGFDSDLLDFMETVGIENPAAIDKAILNQLHFDTFDKKRTRQQFIQEHYQLEHYGKRLVQLLGLISTPDKAKAASELSITQPLDISPDIFL